jgi:hypothetical protein
MSRPNIVVVGDAAGDWSAIEAQADAAIDHLQLRGEALVQATRFCRTRCG